VLGPELSAHSSSAASARWCSPDCSRGSPRGRLRAAARRQAAAGLSAPGTWAGRGRRALRHPRRGRRGAKGHFGKLPFLNPRPGGVLVDRRDLLLDPLMHGRDGGVVWCMAHDRKQVGAGPMGRIGSAPGLVVHGHALDAGSAATAVCRRGRAGGGRWPAAGRRTVGHASVDGIASTSGRSPSAPASSGGSHRRPLARRSISRARPPPTRR